MTDGTSEEGLDNRSPAAILRERAERRLRLEIEDLLRPWWDDHQANPDRVPPPPDTALASNPYWWAAIGVTSAGVEVIPRSEDADPLGRLATPYPEASERIGWLRERISALRLSILRDEGTWLRRLLAAQEVRLTGIRTPVIEHGGERTDVPLAVLRAPNWRLTPEEVLEMNGTQSTFTELKFTAISTDCLIKMTRLVERLKRENGMPPSREDVLKAPRDHFMVDALKRAHAQLPPELRRGQGGSVRAGGGNLLTRTV